MSTIESVPGEEVKEACEDDRPKSPPKEIIRYSLSTLLSLRSSKLSQAKPACKNLELSCMAHHKPPPKMLIANMMPKFALNQMQNRGEESISPLSFHSNSSSSSNLSYQKRYQDRDDGYSNSRYYYNKYNKYDDNGGSSRIIYKTTANASNGNNIRFLKKAYNSKYENEETASSELLSSKNILGNSSRVITIADIRGGRKLLEDDEKKEEKVEEKKKSDDTNNNEKKEAEEAPKPRNDLKNLPDDITNQLDDMFNNLNIENMTEERESSRFSKWFTVNKEEEEVQNNNDNVGNAFPQSVESEKYFQPIDKVESNSLFNLLKGPQESQQKSPNSGQVHSVEELEARLRQHKVEEPKSNESEQKALQNFFQQHQQQQQQQFMPPQQHQEDVNAFKKLLSQITGEEGNKVPAPNIMQMNKAFPQRPMMQGQKMNPMIPPQPQPFVQKMPIPEVMKRPEVQAIVQELNSGEISQYNLWQRLTTPGLSPIERDIITSALNIFNANGNFQTLFPKAPIPSPLSPVPPPLDQHLLFQHQAAAAAANKLRLSPLPAGGIPQRIPSPRELQYHTQSIMQNALIRKKLEEQRENFRKRQEQEQKEHMQKQENERKNSSPVQSPEENPFDSPIKKPPPQHLQRQHAPSPNIFTPTSVLRKMTAEKDGDGKIGSDKKKAITGGNSQQQPIRSQHQTQQQQYLGNLAQLDRMMQMQAQNDAFGKVNWDAQASMKPQGRPIVKGAGPVGPQQSNPMMAAAQQQQQPNMMPPGNFDFQQHQIQKMNMQKQFLQQQQMMQMKKDNPVLTQFMAQQQQRAQQQQQHMIRSQQFPQMNFQQQQMMQGRKDQDEMENRNMVNNGGCLSPTSNQLAKWFSPELLADATAGKLPSMKMNGQMLSLEEFEKFIHNP